ncbi:MAG: ATP-binding cassette domain-containing protein [Ignavibacteria bacterium]|nr:ATP-binding cassette domain-containing protein [Ignavibacteria bacterium]MBT8383776.1 ATP-binding cassette domain-containing protein [Ignavibacteria bacterium]MBT8391781.1 ATP-binding cassette domain-containing protein [Ignavibacteria bacterium]NNJ52339.1 ATP-binding cassette domain-containing protein [Ignavibacteriaceae bacterium]NNL21072.1 ATP-binding cassette domain-containing protein [Ignavibacteriaceae bacterium]
MIEINNLHKSFGSNKVLRGVNLDIDTGETIVVIGRSGCGKSVLVKHIVGLLYPDEGYVKIEGRRVDEMDMQELYELRTGFGFLFQGSALFDSMTVEENIALPLVESKNIYTKDELDSRIEEKLEMVGMSGVQKLKPAELSGGMKKRVGLARALITDPDYIFYDEPTTGLDPIMSDSIDELIKELTDRLNVTSIVVTHDMYSVKEVAHQVAMMHEGIIHFVGSPKELLNSDDFIIREFIKRTE